MADRKVAAPAASAATAISTGPGHSRGKLETELLKATINDQLNRLLTQLEDLEELKAGRSVGRWLVARSRYVRGPTRAVVVVVVVVVVCGDMNRVCGW